MRIHQLRHLFAIARLWLVLAMPALFSALAWSQEYTLTDLGTLGGSSSFVVAVNDAGQVVGTADVPGDGHSDPFLYFNGTMKDVWPGGTEFGGATVAINDSGGFVVNYVLSGGETESYLWNGANWADLGTGGATGMNDSNAVVGYSSQGYWLYSDSLLNISPGYSLPLGTLAAAYAINNAGTIVGECGTAIPFSPSQNGCIFGPDVSVALFGADLGGPPDTPYALSSDDETCGSNGVSQFAIWSETGAETYATNIGYAAQCNSLDDYGVAVGNGYPSVDSGLTAGYIYDPVNKLRDLNSLVHPLIHKGHAISIENAQSVSDTGFIAADCFIGNFSTYQLVTHACLLSPNWALIIRDSFVALAKGDPECIQCKTELEPEANSLPSSFTRLTVEEKKKAVATLEKIESQLVVLRDGDQISEQAAVLLLHDTEMTLQTLGHPRG